MIRKITKIMALLISNLAVAGQSSFDLQQLPISEVISLYYREATKKPYVLCDAVLRDTRLISVRASGKRLDAALLSAALVEYGYVVRQRSGVDVICSKPEPIISPPDELIPFVYRTQHRSSTELVSQLAPIVGGTFAVNRPVSGATAVASPNTTQSPTLPTGTTAATPGTSFQPRDLPLVYSGTAAQIQRLQKLLKQLDVPIPEVQITGYLYEVTKNDTDGSALNMVLNALNGRIELSLPGTSNAGSVLRLRTNSIDSVYHALRSDSRFVVVTNPYIRVRDDSTARLQVGDDVPTLGAIVTTSNGQSSQSIEYRSSGVILEVKPRIRESSTDLDITQTVSDFLQTDTSIRSPTLSKREIRTSLSAEPGEVLVIGGLNYEKSNKSKSGLWFLPWALSRSSGTKNMELLLVLHISRV